MSEFKSLNWQDQQRIKSGIVYLMPARVSGGANEVVGTFGDLTHKAVGMPGHKIDPIEFFAHTKEKIEFWMLSRVNRIVETGVFNNQEGWAMVDGLPVASSPVDAQ